MRRTWLKSWKVWKVSGSVFSPNFREAREGVSGWTVASRWFRIGLFAGSPQAQMHRFRVLLFLWEKTDCYNSRVASKAAFAADLQECGGAFFFSLLFLEHSEFWVGAEGIWWINEPDLWQITAVIYRGTNERMGWMSAYFLIFLLTQ